MDEFTHVSPFHVHVSPSTALDELYPPKSTSLVAPDPDTYANAASERADGAEPGNCDAQSGPWNCVAGDDPPPSGWVTPPTVVVATAGGVIAPDTGRVTVIGAPLLIAIVTDAARSDSDNAGPDALIGPIGTPAGDDPAAKAACLGLEDRTASGRCAAEAGTGTPATNAARRATTATTATTRRDETDPSNLMLIALYFDPTRTPSRRHEP